MSLDELDMANGLNALHYAIIFKQGEIVEALLESGADLHRPSWSKLSPLQLAILSPTPFREAVKLLTTSRHNICVDVDHIIDGTKWVRH